MLVFFSILQRQLVSVLKNIVHRSPKQLVDAGIPYVILGKSIQTKKKKKGTDSYDNSFPWGRSGHSERRTLFHETSELVATKTRAAIDAGLKVILCIGETLEQRELGQTSQVCEDQVKAVVDVTKVVDWG